MSAPGTGYPFGDTRTAEGRLDLVAAVFDHPSRAFLSRAVSSRAGAAARVRPRLRCGITWRLRQMVIRRSMAIR